MEPKIVTKAAFNVTGMVYYGKNENNEITRLWDQFMSRAKEIQCIAGENFCYGVCGKQDESGAFKYLAGFTPANPANVPNGMEVWQVPAQTYAVFPCTLEAIGQTYTYAFSSWLPQSGYQVGDGPDFEFYDETFDPNQTSSLLYVYIPIK